MRILQQILLLCIIPMVSFANVTSLEMFTLNDGTAPFSVDSTAGNDDSANNEIVRTHDDIRYRATFVTDGGDSSVIGTFVLPSIDAGPTAGEPAAKWKEIPPQCLASGSSLSADGGTLICNMGDFPNPSTVAIEPIVKVSGRTPNGQEIDFAVSVDGEGSATAQSTEMATAIEASYYDTVVTAGVASKGVLAVDGRLDQLVSATPRFDLMMGNSLNHGSGYTRASGFNGLGGPNGEAGRALAYGVFMFAHELKGSEMLNPNIPFEYTVTTTDANISGQSSLQTALDNSKLVSWTGAQGNQNQNLNPGCKNGPLNGYHMLGDRGTVNKNHSIVLNGGTVNCSQASDGEPIVATVSNIDSSLEHFPTYVPVGGGTNPTDNNEWYVMSKIVSQYLFLDDIPEDTRVTLNTCVRMTTAPVSISGQVNVDINPYVDETDNGNLGNQCQAEGFERKLFGLAGMSHTVRAISNTAAGADVRISSDSRVNMAKPGEQYHSRLYISNTASETLKYRMCEKLDNARQKLLTGSSQGNLAGVSVQKGAEEPSNIEWGVKVADGTGSIHDSWGEYTNVNLVQNGGNAYNLHPSLGSGTLYEEANCGDADPSGSTAGVPEAWFPNHQAVMDAGYSLDQVTMLRVDGNLIAGGQIFAFLTHEARETFRYDANDVLLNPIGIDLNYTQGDFIPSGSHIPNIMTGMIYDMNGTEIHRYRQRDALELGENRFLRIRQSSVPSAGLEVAVGNSIEYTLTPNYASPSSNLTPANIMVTNVLPENMTYVSTTSGPTPLVMNNTPSLGFTTLVWTMANQVPIQQTYGGRDFSTAANLSPIVFEARVNTNSVSGDKLVNWVTLSDGGNDSPLEGDCTDYNTSIVNDEYVGYANCLPAYGSAVVKAEKTLNLVSAPPGFQIFTEGLDPIVSVASTYRNTINWASIGSSMNDLKVIDIFPYNGDARGSNFTGTNTLVSVAKNSELNSSTATLYYTKALASSINSDPSDASNVLDGSSIWCDMGDDATTPDVGSAGCPLNLGEATALLVNQTSLLLAGTTYGAELLFTQTANKEHDVYKNSISAQGSSINLISSNSVETEVLTPSIVSRVWNDANRNGVVDNSESGFSSVRVTLGGNDIDGTAINIFADTNASGYYEFNLSNGLIKASDANGYTLSVSNPPAGMVTTYDVDDGYHYPNTATTQHNSGSIVLNAADDLTNVNFGYATPFVLSVGIDVNDSVTSSGGVALTDIFGNDNVNGATFTLGTDANITQITTTTLLDINLTTGIVTVPTNTPAGIYTENYTVCENTNPSNCMTADIRVTVLAGEIDAIDDDFSSTIILSPVGAVAGDVTPIGNDTLNGEDINDSLVILSLVPEHSTLTTVTLENNGTLSVDANSTVGTYTVAYKLCEALNPNNCDEANVSVVVLEDTDNDGIADISDPDDDNDGVSDVDELDHGSDPLDNSSSTLASIASVVEDIAGNADGRATTANEINIIDGVENALTDVDYSTAFANGSYVDRANPTVEEIQVAIDEVNAITAIFPTNSRDTCAKCTPKGWFADSGTPDVSNREHAADIGTSRGNSPWYNAPIPLPPNGHTTWVSLRDLGPANALPEEVISTTIKGLTVGETYVVTLYTLTALSYYAQNYSDSFSFQVGSNPLETVLTTTNDAWVETKIRFVATQATEELKLSIGDNSAANWESVQISVDSIMEIRTPIIEDIAGNADATPATAEQINAIAGVENALSGIDYSTALANGTYVDSANPTAAEIQAVIDTYNATVSIDTDNAEHLAILGISKAEADALMALYNDTNGTAWTDKTNWDTLSNISTWKGITVSGGSVTQINLSTNNLAGSIPTELGNLANLTYLNLHTNQLTGSIPTELGSLANLTHLYLYNNQLTGSIPTALGNLANLTHLHLTKNQLTGSIPTALGNLANLTELRLHTNQLTGSIPTELGSLANLTHLYLYNNQLAGSIPTELGSLANLIHLNLANNQLTGSIPTELGNLASLNYLSLSTNQLTESIPTALGNLANLTQLYLYDNQLTGSIPTELGNLASLNYLSLSTNQLTESIPTALGNLANLTYLNLANNQLTGSIPTALGNLANLTQLYLYDNQLTGSIPTELGNLASLNYLSLSTNQLTESIPTALGNLANLTHLHLDNNQLTGSIPTALGNLANLIHLYLANNQLTGSIPRELGSLANLTYLNLHTNQLTESIPTALGNLANLTYLNLHTNQFIHTDLEAMNPFITSVATHDITPQVAVDTNRTIASLFSESNLSITPAYTENPSGNDSYQWYKDGVAIAGATNRVFTKSNIAVADGGVYTYEVNNSVVTELTLKSNNDSEGISVEVIDIRTAVMEDIAGNSDATPATAAEINAIAGVENALTGIDYSTAFANGSYVDRANPTVEEIQNVIDTHNATVTIDTDNAEHLAILGVSKAEADALLALYNDTNGTAWTDDDNWTTLTLVSTWKGITTTAGSVTSIELDDNNLSGTIPNELEDLRNLEYLTLEQNGLTGSIPSVLGNLSNLIELNLNENKLSGSIPIELGDLSTLTHLRLYYNELTGTIPTELGDLSSMVYFNVSRNQLTGSIPSELGNFRNMNALYLQDNQLSGTIPNELVDITWDASAYALNLSDNDLTGAIPNFDNKLVVDGIGSWTGHGFDIFGNEFTFEDLEPNYMAIINLPDVNGTDDGTGYDLSSQQVVDTNRTIASLFSEANLTITPEYAENVSGNDSYQWYKNGVAIAGATDRIFTKSNIEVTDGGVYTYTVSNSVVTELTLQSHKPLEGISVEVIDIRTAVMEDIAGNADGIPATAEEINAIGGVSGALTGVDYSRALANGTYVDSANPTPTEIQMVIDAHNAHLNGLAEVIEDIAGNSNSTATTASQLNAINGVSGAVMGIDYSTALANGTYVDSVNPTAQEIQTVVTNANNALALIQAYAEDNNATVPSVQDYMDAGITGVDADNLNAVNAAIDASDTAGTDTVAEVQAIADAGNTRADNALSLIGTYASNTDRPNSATAPSVQDY
ncbi:MAG: Adenylate cyclase (EC, partial [uncultured Sulfurovum sp.]